MDDPFRYLVPRYEAYTVPAGMVPGLFDYLDYPDVGSLSMPVAAALRLLLHFGFRAHLAQLLGSDFRR